MPLKTHTKINATPLQGGAVTVREPALLPNGAFSMVQNVRPENPGFIKRPGQRRQHSTADGSNVVDSLYQFRKARVDEKHFFAQMSDGDILEATNDPPTTTTGAFGSEVFDGSSGQIPASWAQIVDLMIHSNGVDQHQIYAGTSSYITKFVKYDGSAAPPSFPELGFDYSEDVRDGQTTTYADLDALDTYANNECFYMAVPVSTQSLTVTIKTANSNTSTLSVYYRKDDGTWATVSGLSDGTSASSKTLAQTGTITWTAPTDEIDHFQYGVDAYWYQFRVSAQLSATVEISGVTFSSGFQDVANLWDGVPVDAIEVMVEGTTQFETYGSGAVDLDELASGKKIVLASVDPVEAIYIDVGSVPNATGTALTSLKYWDGDSWVSVGAATDGTSGMSNSGWITFPRQSAVQPLHFESTQYYAYWYELIWDSALSADVEIAIQVRPYYDITSFGTAGYCCRAYHDRMTYTFNQWGEYLNISAASAPQVLNGTDFGIIEMGDGRPHKVRAAKNFYNNLLVWQEEKGVEGGCTTLLQGYDPATYGKLVLSSRIGVMNAKSATVVENVKTSADTAEEVKTMAFWLSRYGVCASDGKSISIISDDVQNYFDPDDSNSIRRAYTDENWLEYDSRYHGLRIGLTTGDTAVTPNTHLFFDLTDNVWYVDSLGQRLSCMTEIEADSGEAHTLQMGGGVSGYVYETNYGDNDVSTAVNTYIDIEFSIGGLLLLLSEVLLQCKVQSAGNITLTPYCNSIAQTAKTLSMTAAVTNQTIRTHRFNMNVRSRQITLRLQHNTADQDMYLERLGVKLLEWEGA